MSAAPPPAARIAWIDSDAERRARGHAWLEAAGATMVGEPEEGLASLDLLGLDVIVLEQGHPSVEWASFLAEVQVRSVDAPVIVIPSGPDQEEVVLRAGAYDVLREPLSKDGCEAALRRAREHRRLALRVRELEARRDDAVVPLRELEQQAIEKALAVTRGSVEKAARLLGMGRATLYRRLATLAASRTDAAEA